MSFSINNQKTINNNFQSNNDSSGKKLKGYTTREKQIIILTILITILGILLRSWRILREGMPIAFDGYHFQEVSYQVFKDGWFDFRTLFRDPPGFYFIFVIVEYMLGLPGEPIMWSIFVLPQVIASLQLVIYYVLARRLTHSRMTGLLTMFIMSFIGLIVYRNQNVAPETIVLGLVPFVTFFLLRFLETNDYRFLISAFLITGAIIMIHHLSTLFVLAIWHVILFYDLIYRHIKEKRLLTKNLIMYFILIAFLDTCVLLFWFFVLKNYPLEFAANTLSSLFPEGAPIAPIVLMIISIAIVNIILLVVLFYNFDKEKINKVFIIISIVSMLAMFIITLFFGVATPDTTFITALLVGTPILVLPPLGAIGLTSIPETRYIRSRILRGWLYSNIAIISWTAIIPIMSSILGRLALYIIGVGVLLASIAIVKLISKVKKNQLRGLALIALIGSMGLTMTYAYPEPESNWGQQEIYWDAEFKTVDFLVIYSHSANHPYYDPENKTTVDGDLRLSLIIEGYGGLDATFGYNHTSWLTRTLLLENESMYNFTTQQKPTGINYRIDYLFVTRIMFEDGYITDWANYGTTKENWILKLQLNGEFLSLNPYLHRVYANGITFLLYEF